MPAPLPALSVGLPLWWVPAISSAPARTVTVRKIGRKWAELDNSQRIDINTWQADGRGYPSPGTCYASEDEFRARVELEEAWAEKLIGVLRVEGVKVTTRVAKPRPPASPAALAWPPAPAASPSRSLV